jgi:hypothetical protein
VVAWLADAAVTHVGRTGDRFEYLSRSTEVTIVRRRPKRRLLLLIAASALAFGNMPAGASHSVDEHSPNLVHIFNSKNPNGAINSDLAFWENLAVAGNYRGFRVFDITKPQRPVLLSAFPCNGGQGDVSIYQAKERLLVIQSVDTPQNVRTCNSSNVSSDAFPGPADWEGVRIIDITDPRNPFFVTAVEVDCGSHTHTTIPDDDDQRALVYVSSYPLPPGIGDECFPPHSKIAIVEIPDDNPAAAHILKYQPIHAQPAPGGHGEPPGTIGCHDINVFLDPKTGQRLAAAACLSEAQLWDITDPANPCTVEEACHTHIDNPFVEIWHSAALTWDGEVILFWDEHGGGVGPGCAGEQDTEGNIWFYKNQGPGQPAPLFGRYHIPRPEVTEPPPGQECTLHLGSIIPINDNEAYIAVSSAYRAGTSVFEFTPLKTRPTFDVPLPDVLPDPVPPELIPPIVATEIAYYDSWSGDGRGADDAWTTYWYNDYMYTNGGLNRDSRGDRGFDVYRLLDERGRPFKAKSFHHFNPQTQEVYMTLGG